MDSCLTTVNQMVGGSGTELSDGIARSRIDLSYDVCIDDKCFTVISLAVPSLQNIRNHSHHPLNVTTNYVSELKCAYCVKKRVKSTFAL